MDYREKFYKKYNSSHVCSIYNEQSLPKIKREFPVWQKHFENFLPNNKKARILDLGCGSGGFIFWLRSIGFTEIEGVDVSEEQVKESERLGISNVSWGDALSFLQNKKNSYEAVIARDFLEHFAKDELIGVVSAVLESLKEKGVFIVQTVNAETWLGSRLRYADFTHETAFTQNSIRQLFSVSGFSSAKVYPMRPVVKGAVSFTRYMLWRLIECVFHIYLLAATGYRKGIFTQDILAVARK